MTFCPHFGNDLVYKAVRLWAVFVGVFLVRLFFLYRHFMLITWPFVHWLMSALCFNFHLFTTFNSGTRFGTFKELYIQHSLQDFLCNHGNSLLCAWCLVLTISSTTQFLKNESYIKTRLVDFIMKICFILSFRVKLTPICKISKHQHFTKLIHYMSFNTFSGGLWRAGDILLHFPLKVLCFPIKKTNSLFIWHRSLVQFAANASPSTMITDK